jgi:hypothetical protein
MKLILDLVKSELVKRTIWRTLALAHTTSRQYGIQLGHRRIASAHVVCPSSIATAGKLKDKRRNDIAILEVARPRRN